MGGTQGMKSSSPTLGTFYRPGIPFLLFKARGAGREPFLAKGRHCKRLPLSPSLDTCGAGPNPHYQRKVSQAKGGSPIPDLPPRSPVPWLEVSYPGVSLKGQ